MRTRCEHHEGLCAFDGDEPARCPACHMTWRRILACECEDCGRSLAHHEAVHARREAVRVKKNARRKAQGAARRR